MVAWIALALVALLELRQRKLPSQEQAVWMLVILIIPVIGALIWLFGSPNHSASSQGKAENL